MSRLCWLVACFSLSACGPEHEERVAPSWTGEPQDRAVLWQGFEQRWGYNHRLNSLGDYVGPLQCDGVDCGGTLVHTAASGSGADTAVYASRATVLQGPGVQFLQGSFRFAIDEEVGEGEPLTRTLAMEVPLDGALLDRDQYHLLLNGFDLYATDDADKLVFLDLALGAPEVSEGVVVITAHLDLALDCDSLECDGFGDKLDTSVRYIVEVPWLLVAADADALRVTELDVATRYAWGDERSEELERDDIARTIQVQGEPGWTEGVFAFTSLSIDLDDEHHMAEWATQIRNPRHDPATGMAEATVDLMFKQWNEGSLDFVFSYTDAGDASNTAGLALLQLGNPCQAGLDARGSITWQADGSPATSAAAVRAHEVQLDAC